MNDKNYRKIDNMVDETRIIGRKIINFLTNNYKRIYIGKFNIKSIVSKENNTIDKMTKGIALLMKHYEFRQRLKNKCYAKRVMFEEVDEMFTSKTCSVCGNYKDDLGGSEIYECSYCGNTIDRDISAGRCMILKKTK